MKRRVPWYVDQNQIDDMAKLLWAQVEFLRAHDADGEANKIITLLDDFLGQTCMRSSGRYPEFRVRRG